MVPVNNSDTAWLIVSDYNQDNGIFYEDLREDILDPQIDKGDWEWVAGGVGPRKGKKVGSLYPTSDEVGDGDNEIDIGGDSFSFPGSGNMAGEWVGGYLDDSNQ